MCIPPKWLYLWWEKWWYANELWCKKTLFSDRPTNTLYILVLPNWPGIMITHRIRTPFSTNYIVMNEIGNQAIYAIFNTSVASHFPSVSGLTASGRSNSFLSAPRGPCARCGARSPLCCWRCRSSWGLDSLDHEKVWSNFMSLIQTSRMGDLGHKHTLI